jgi:hypothetical protein
VHNFKSENFHPKTNAKIFRNPHDLREEIGQPKFAPPPKKRSIANTQIKNFKVSLIILNIRRGVNSGRSGTDMRRILVAFIKRLLCIIPTDGTDTKSEESNDDWRHITNAWQWHYEPERYFGMPYALWELATG